MMEVAVDERLVDMFPDMVAAQDPHGFYYLASPTLEPMVGGAVLVEVGGVHLWGRVLRIRGGELLVDTYGRAGLVYAEGEQVVGGVVGVVTVGGKTVPDPSFADALQDAPDGPGRPAGAE